GGLPGGAEARSSRAGAALGRPAPSPGGRPRRGSPPAAIPAGRAPVGRGLGDAPRAGAVALAGRRGCRAGRAAPRGPGVLAPLAGRGFPPPCPGGRELPGGGATPGDLGGLGRRAVAPGTKAVAPTDGRARRVVGWPGC